MLLGRHPLGLEQLRDAHPEALGLVLQVVGPALHLGIDQRRWQRHVDPGEVGLQDAATELVLRLLDLATLQGVTQVGAQLLDGVELRGGGREVIVEIGQGLLPHVLDGDVEGGLRAAVHRVVLGQLVVVAEGVPGLLADGLLVELGGDATGADLVEGVLDGGVLEHLPVHLHLEVEGDQIALLGGTFHLVDLGEALPHRAELVVDLVLVDVPLGEGDRDPRVVRRIEGGPDLDGGGEDAAFGLVEGVDVDLRLGDGIDVLGLQRLAVVLVEGLLHRGLRDHALTEALLQQPAGHLALAETRQVHLLCELTGGAVHGLLDALGLDLDGELDLDGVYRLDGGLHGGRILGTWVGSGGGRAGCAGDAAGRHPSTGARRARQVLRFVVGRDGTAWDGGSTRHGRARMVPPVGVGVHPGPPVGGGQRAAGAQPERCVAGYAAAATGCGAAWLAHLLWEQGAAGSNPATPTILSPHHPHPSPSRFLLPAAGRPGRAGQRSPRLRASSFRVTRRLT